MRPHSIKASRLLSVAILALAGVACGGGGGGGSAATSNSAPVANAGADLSVAPGSVVQLDASASTDVDGDLLTYQWTLLTVPPGSQASLTDATAIRPSFNVDLPGAYIAQLTVNDGQLASAPDTVQISTGNSAPTANAGPDQTAPVGSLVTLNGTGSTDPDGNTLGYQWSLTSKPAGSTAALSDPTAAGPTLVPDAAGSYTVSLVVNDGQVSSTPDVVLINTANSAPVANAGSNLQGTVGGDVLLDGSASSDVDGDALTYAWTLVSRPLGSIAAITGANQAVALFAPDVAGVYVAQLIVNDGSVDSTPDTTTLSVTVPTAALTFDLAAYSPGVGQNFTVQVFLDGDLGLAGPQALANGLFSYGIRLGFDPARASVSSVNAITVPAELDFNGFSAGAQKAVGSGFAAVKGTIDQLAATAYAGTVVATFQVTNLAVSGTYPLRLEIYRTLGESEQVFLDGNGAVLDPELLLGTAQVTVVP